MKTLYFGVQTVEQATERIKALIPLLSEEEKNWWSYIIQLHTPFIPVQLLGIFLATRFFIVLAH
jgi:hypothetical protein